MKLLEKLGHRSRILAVSVAIGGIISAILAAFGNTAVPLAYASVCLAGSICFGLLERSGNRENNRAHQRHLLLLSAVAGKIDKTLATGQTQKRDLQGLGVVTGKLEQDLGVLSGKLDAVIKVEGGLSQNLDTVLEQQGTAMRESKSRQAVLHADMGRLLESQQRILRRLEIARASQKTNSVIISSVQADSGHLRKEFAAMKDGLAKAPEPVTEEMLKKRFVANSSRLTTLIEETLKEQAVEAATLREAEAENFGNVIESALAIQRAELNILASRLLDLVQGADSSGPIDKPIATEKSAV